MTLAPDRANGGEHSVVDGRCPFLVVDLVVSSVLLSMGMMMLPPVVVSFPFKVLLFVMVDGWHLLVGSLVQSFR